ncbi:hypothetical protein EDB89DRAFT_550163 [Lactarius sanguifluus]|nr:hypothetical protein EDB89DRAFT_550163 [Lactarius sanguifluus]
MPLLVVLILSAACQLGLKGLNDDSHSHLQPAPGPLKQATRPTPCCLCSPPSHLRRNAHSIVLNTHPLEAVKTLRPQVRPRRSPWPRRLCCLWVCVPSFASLASVSLSLSLWPRIFLLVNGKGF